MRIRQIIIKKFRSVRDQVLEPEGTVILCGPNSAGKSTILDAVRASLGDVDNVRRDPFGEETGDPWVDATVVFKLNGSGLPGHPDTVLHEDLITGALGGDEDWVWGFLDDALPEQLRGASLGTAQATLADTYAEHGGPGDATDRTTVATAILRSRLFAVREDETWLLADPDDLTTDELAAAGRIAAPGDAVDDALFDDCRELSAGKTASVAPVAVGYIEEPALRKALGGYVDIDSDPSQLAREVRDAIITVHDLLWTTPRAPRPAGSLCFIFDQYGIREASHGAGQYVCDPWLETQGEDPGRIVTDAPTSEADALRWHRIRPSLIAAARLLEARANERAPGFVRDLGAIGIQVLPPTFWPVEQDRVRIGFHDDSGLRDLAVIGAGVSRWVAVAIRLSIVELTSSVRQIADHDGKAATLVEKQIELVKEARSDPLEQRLVRLVPAAPEAVLYLVDEPEAHLHPAALASVAQWMTDLSDLGNSVLIATHQPALVNKLARGSRFILVRMGPEGTSCDDVTDDLHRQLAGAGVEIGLSAGDLLLMTRLALFVEGPHDAAVFDAVAGEELALAGVRVFPLHGLDNANALVDSEVVHALGIPIGVLTDRTDRDNLRLRSPRSKEEKITLRLLDEARRAGRTVSPFGLKKPDIVEYLDEDACRAEAPAFPGWDTAVQEWTAARRQTGFKTPFKDFVTSTYGLRLDRDSVYRLALATRFNGAVPAELDNCVRSILARAAATTR